MSADSQPGLQCPGSLIALRKVCRIVARFTDDREFTFGLVKHVPQLADAGDAVSAQLCKHLAFGQAAQPQLVIAKSAVVNEDPDPVVMMEPIRLYRAMREPLPDTLLPIELGTARVRRTGPDVTLVAWGAVVPAALEAAEQVATEGIEVEVVDPRTLKPLDWQTLTASVEKTGRLVVAHEAPQTGGPGGELVAGLVERCFYALRSPPRRVAGADVVYPPQLLEDEYLPDAARIAVALRESMEG